MRFAGWLILFVVAEVPVALASGCAHAPEPPRFRLIFPAPVIEQPGVFDNCRPCTRPDPIYDHGDLVA